MTENQATPEAQQAVQLPTPQPTLAALPELPCPNCGANVLEHHGFHNYCTETQSLREDSYLYRTNGRIYLEHDESGYETDSHECQATAFCSSCDNELPWSLFDIREMDGETFESASAIIKALIEQASAEDADGNTEAEPPSVPAAAPTSADQHAEVLQ